MGDVDANVVVDVAPAAALLWIASIVPRRRHRRALILGAALVLLAVSPPLHAWAHVSVTGHMVQHLILLVVAAPVITSGLAGAAHVIPPPLRRVLRTRWALVSAAILHVATLGLWHLPRPYDAALANGWVHAVGHITLLAPAVWWWAAIGAQSRRRDPFLAAISLMAVATAGAVVGTLLMFAGPIYVHGDVADQQVAGAVMAGTGAVYGAAGLWLVARAIGRLERPRRREPWSIAATITAAIAAGVVVGLAVAARTSPAAEPPLLASDDVDGEMLYLRDCAWCHAPNGEGTARGIDITEVGPASVQYTLTTGRMPIDHPRDAVRRSRPAYTDREIVAIVEHTRRFGSGPEIPPLEPSVGVAQGGELYRLHCAACHGSTGIGGAQSFGRVAPPVLDATAEEVAAVIVAGPGGMPSFVGTFDDPEIAGITEYVAVLQDPPRRGIPIPGARVGEGLVAWLVGVVALVLTAAWMGKRA